MAKGTFYLYFKDKFDIRDKLIADKARQVFCRALEEMNRVQLDSLEDHVIFLINSVINQLNQNKNLLKFISKNLSWGVFQKAPAGLLKQLPMDKELLTEILHRLSDEGKIIAVDGILQIRK